jgi:hypothetical protein
MDEIMKPSSLDTAWKPSVRFARLVAVAMHEALRLRSLDKKRRKK